MINLKQFGLNKHYKFERFGIISSILVCVLVVIFVIASIHQMHINRQELSDNVIYTTKFTTSVSDVQGTVVNIYKSKDNTKAFLLLNIKDINNISLDAKNYKIFMTGARINGEYKEQEKLYDQNINGSIYMFGSTGYMGIYLVNTNTFPSQICDLVVRCDAITGDAADISDSTATSFDKYDQFRIYFNPGGANCDRAEFLNTNKWTVIDAYEECVSRSAEQKIRDTLANDLKKMSTQQKAINDYINRLTNLSNPVVVPDTPVMIADDVFTTADDGHIEYSPKYVIAKGYDFDWYNGSIKTGYLKNLCGDKTYTQFLASKKREADTNRFSTAFKWSLADGTLVSDLDKSIASNQNIDNSIKLLTSAWENYYNLKKQYQCVDLQSLIYLEINTLNVKTDYTINDGDIISFY